MLRKSWATKSCAQSRYWLLGIFLRGNDVFVSLPTGSGKSLCYCLLPLVFDLLRQTSEAQSSIDVVVSPLIALMQDQVRGMNECGVRAVYAGITDDELAESVCDGSFQLVYLSPESLITDGRWRGMLQNPIYQERLVGLAVDEALCEKMVRRMLHELASHD